MELLWKIAILARRQHRPYNLRAKKMMPFKNMICYCVIHHTNILVGVYSSAVDAHLVQKQLLGSTVQQCHLNAETIGEGKLLQPPV